MMHSDVKKIVHESVHRGHTIKIVEREMDKVFLYFYVLDDKGNESGGMYHCGYDKVTSEDLADLSVCIPKIKSGIDYNIDLDEKYEKEKREKKEKMKWTGRQFKRGDFVHYKGNEKYKPQDTYVWTHFGHHGIDYYLIEHEQGEHRDNFTNKRPFRKFGVGADGFEAVHSSQLDENLKYIPVHCTEFQWETDELEMIKEAPAGASPKPKNQKMKLSESFYEEHCEKVTILHENIKIYGDICRLEAKMDYVLEQIEALKKLTPKSRIQDFFEKENEAYQKEYALLEEKYKTESN